MAEIFALADGARAQRKLLLTFVQWGGTYADESDSASYTGEGIKTALIGARTEDSSIELNIDAEDIYDILGRHYTDINRTEPKQTVDPFYILGGSNGAADLAKKLAKAALTNKLQDECNGTFNILVVTAFFTNSATTPTAYYAVRHRNSTVYPQSLGGDNYVSMPIEIGFSNRVVEGTVNKLDESLTFTVNGSL